MNEVESIIYGLLKEHSLSEILRVLAFFCENYTDLRGAKK